MDAAGRYVNLRVRWYFSPVDSRKDVDAERSRAHEVIIGAFNILSRAMVQRGEKNDWRRDVGHDRRVPGDVASHILRIVALKGVARDQSLVKPASGNEPSRAGTIFVPWSHQC